MEEPQVVQPARANAKKRRGRDSVGSAPPSKKRARKSDDTAANVNAQQSPEVTQQSLKVRSKNKKSDVMDKSLNDVTSSATNAIKLQAKTGATRPRKKSGVISADSKETGAGVIEDAVADKTPAICVANNSDSPATELVNELLPVAEIAATEEAATDTTVADYSDLIVASWERIVAAPASSVKCRNANIRPGRNLKKRELLDNGVAVSPSPRWGHTCCLRSGTAMIVIGGEAGQSCCKDAIYDFDADKHFWEVPKTSSMSGAKPEGRTGHTAVFDPMVKAVYVYGGSSRGSKWYNDVHVLNLVSGCWRMVQTQGSAPYRSYHTATLFRHEFWIFGGIQPTGGTGPDETKNDIHVFSPLEENWYKPIVMGTPPPSRSGHSATLFNEKLVIFGGWDDPKIFNDIHILDLSLVEWQQPKVNGRPPVARTWHAATGLSSQRLLIHGGFCADGALESTHIFDIGTSTWSEIVLQPSLSPRCGHTAVRLPRLIREDNNDHVIVFGGGNSDKDEFYDDVICLKVPLPRTAIRDDFEDSNHLELTLNN